MPVVWQNREFRVPVQEFRGDVMYCPSCGKPAEAGVRFCPVCGAQVSSGFAPGQGTGAAAYPPPGVYAQRKLVRPRYPRMIAGVCSGFALQFGWDVTLVRVITAALGVLTSGAVGLAYLVAWVIIPEAAYALPMAAAYPPPAAEAGPASTPPPPQPGSTAV
jgi:phage shock protein C